MLEKLTKFRPWVQKIMPTVYDDSLTYYELVSKVIAYMNQVVDQSNELVDYTDENLVKLKDDLTVLEKWMKNEALPENVSSILDQWTKDGRFTEFVENTVFEDFNKRVSDLALSVKIFGVKGDGVTDDQKNIQKAVTYAYENNRKLFWPNGIYISSDNIQNFHDVVHTGEGKIKRGLDVFSITPTVNDTNILYTGYGSTAGNDGLSGSFPRGISYVRNVLQNLGDKASDGQWRIQFVNGLYKDAGIVFNNMPYFAKPLQVWGTYDGVSHLAVWDGSTSTPVYAIRGDGNNNSMNIEFRDIKFINWKGHPSNAGAIVFWQGVNVRTYNVHCIDCTIGVWCRGGFSTHYGDRMENCVWGYGFQYSHTATLGSSIYPRNTIKNCQKGIMVGRTTVIHADYTDFLDNVVNIQVHQKSRVASVQSFFKNWSDVSHWLQGDSIFEDDGSTWDEASITDATPIYRFDNGSSVPAVHLGPVPYRVAHYVPNTGFTVNGGESDVLISAQTGLGSPLRIPKHLLYNNATVQIVVKARVDVAGAGGTKTLKLTGASNAASQVIATLDIPASTKGGGLGEVTFEISFRSNGSAIYKAKYESSNVELNVVKFATVSSSVITAIRDKTTDLTLWRLYGTVPTAGDSLSVFSLTTNLIG